MPWRFSSSWHGLRPWWTQPSRNGRRLWTPSSLPEIGGPVGYSGAVISMGVRLAVVEPRIVAAVLFAGSFVPRTILDAARHVTISLHVLLQWDEATTVRWRLTSSTPSAPGRRARTPTWVGTPGSANAPDSGRGRPRAWGPAAAASARCGCSSWPQHSSSSPAARPAAAARPAIHHRHLLLLVGRPPAGAALASHHRPRHRPHRVRGCRATARAGGPARQWLRR